MNLINLKQLRIPKLKTMVGVSFMLASPLALGQVSPLPTCGAVFGGGGSATEIAIDSLCEECSVSNQDAAIDGSSTSVATLMIGTAGGGGDLAIRGVAQSGTVYPSGLTPGAYLRHNEALVNSIVYVRTYLGGELVQQGLNHVGVGFIEYTDPVFYGISANTDFDKVEIALFRGSTGYETNIDVLEICTDQ